MQVGIDMSNRRQEGNPVQNAVRYLNEGAYIDAAAVLRSALVTTPDDPVALTLMGVTLLETGAAGDAEIYLRRALTISPGRPEILQNLAKAVRLSGRPAEAVSLCEAALKHAPDCTDALVELATAHVAAGLLDSALELQRRLVRRHPDVIELRRFMAATFRKMDRSSDAEQTLREALTLACDDPTAFAEVHSDLADLLKARRAFEDAAAHYTAAARGDPGARPHKGRAAVLQHLRCFDEAIDALKAALESEPLDLDAHLQLNELLFRQKLDDDFLSSYDKAAAARPGSSVPLVAKGRLLLKIGMAEAAQGYFDDALVRTPGNVDARVGRARALESLGAKDSALNNYERALRVAPDHAGALIDVSSLFLRNGEAKRALDYAGRALTVAPYSQEALALATLCYRAARDDREYALAGYHTLIRIFDLEPPQGFGTMDAFNAELALYLGELHCDAREHFTQTLRGGTRLYDAILQNGHALVDRLRPEIDRAVALYIRELSPTAPDAFVGRRTSHFGYHASWSSLIAEQGLHLNHVHPEGWISAVYYVAVPGVCKDEADRQGWLKFGEPTADFGSGFGPRRFVEPRPGRLVLFPSYLWHGTTSFSATQPRMTIAFDIVPGRIGPA